MTSKGNHVTSTPDPGAAAPLAPPSAAALTLEAPPAPPTVSASQAPAMAPQVAAEQVPALDAKVDAFLADIATVQVGSPEFIAKADAVRTMGDADVRRAAESSNRMLQAPVTALKEGGLSEGSAVGKSLIQLRRTVEDLDPSQARGSRKLFGLIPIGAKVQDYFRKYQSSQTQLNGILHSLRNGQDELAKDNVSLTMEKQNLWDTMGRLNQYIYITSKLDEKIAAQVAQLEVTDAERADALKKDVLFYVRQKHQDLLTQLAVSVQGYLALDVLIKNNLELMKGVDRASTTTVSALRTAVLVAQALGNQKLVLDQISALNDTTSSMIARTSEMMKDNSAKIQQQAASATIDLDKLRIAFDNVYATMDSIDSFKLQALDTMSSTIGTLETEVNRSREYLDRARRSEANQAALGTSSLDLGAN